MFAGLDRKRPNAELQQQINCCGVPCLPRIWESGDKTPADKRIFVIFRQKIAILRQILT